MSDYTGWHFCAEHNGSPILRDGTPCPGVGALEQYDGIPVLCEQGLHASARAIDALKYAPGPWVRRVELRGTVLTQADKACATERITLAGPVDVSRTLRLFACRVCREQPISNGKVIWDSLTDKRSRKAVEVAERYANGEATKEELTAAWDDSWDAAWAASRAASWAASWDASWDDARAAARAAARDAALEWQNGVLTEMLTEALI